MRIVAILLLFVTAAAASAPEARAQGVQEVMATIRNGGGWVSVPIENGRGTISTVTLPTMGIHLSGCVHVWEGHTGEWRISARDAIGQWLLQVTAKPGQGVRFEHEFGLRAQLEFEFQWSEPRETTLYLWVGLDREDDRPGEACTPKI
jgi:hypothetical protein